MRIKEDFASKRKSEIINYKAKYFIVSEGSNTEPAYFEGLNNSIITKNISIINLLRDYIINCNSHPNHIMKIIDEFILNSIDKKITVLELKNKLDNYIKDEDNNENVNISDIKDRISKNYENEEELNIDNMKQLLIEIFKDEIYKNFVDNFLAYFKRQNETYSPETDKINMVIDRDPQNFKENQYDEVVKFCEDNNVCLYVSNPTFEFWLMLHFPEIENENKADMLNNAKVSNKRRYLEKRLNELCEYNKSKLDFSKFEANIGDAIKREKLFAETLDRLKKELGTNVGLLVEEMLTKKNQ